MYVYCFVCGGDHRDLHLSLRRQRQMCISVRGCVDVDVEGCVDAEGCVAVEGCVDAEGCVAGGLDLIHISEATRPLYTADAVVGVKKEDAEGCLAGVHALRHILEPTRSPYISYACLFLT